MSKQSGVIDSESPNEKPNTDPTDQGNDLSRKGDRTIENVMAENKRKTEEIVGLRSEISEMKDMLSELKEINNPSREERQEIKQLEEGIEQKKAQLRSQKETQPWIEIAKEEAVTAAQQAMFNRQIEDGNYFLEDKAHELGIDYNDKTKFKDFVKKLKPFTMDYADLPPLRRNQLAFRAWQEKEKELSDFKREKEAVEKEKMQNNLMREGRGRIPIDKEKEDRYTNARNSRERLSAVVDLVG